MSRGSELEVADAVGDEWVGGGWCVTLESEVSRCVRALYSSVRFCVSVSGSVCVLLCL